MQKGDAAIIPLIIIILVGRDGAGTISENLQINIHKSNTRQIVLVKIDQNQPQPSPSPQSGGRTGESLLPALAGSFSKNIMVAAENAA